MGKAVRKGEGSSPGSVPPPISFAPTLCWTWVGTWIMTGKANSGLLWVSDNGIFCPRCKLAPEHLALTWEHSHSTFSFACRGTIYAERTVETGVFRCWLKRRFILEYSDSGSRWNKPCRHRPKCNWGLCKTENRSGLITTQTAGCVLFTHKWALLTD